MGLISIITIGTALAVFIIGLFSIKFVRPVEKGLVETFGKFSRIAEPGLNFVIPFIQRMIRVNTTEIRVDVEPQNIITQDKLNATVDAVVYFRIEDVRKAIYGVNSFATSVPSLARTTLRAVIGKMTLADANENRDQINSNVENQLDEQTNAWGIDIVRVELQKIEPPQDVQDAMNEVVKAENDKIAAKDYATATETKADGEKRANIKIAEGRRQGSILQAQGNRESSILEAEGKAKAFDLIEKSFKGNAQLDKQLDVTRDSLSNNSKIILTDKGISPQLIIGELPIPRK